MQEHTEVVKTISILITTMILSCFGLVLDELVPKRLDMKKTETIMYAVASPLSFLSKITTPIVKILTSSTDLIIRLFGVNQENMSEEVTEEEIRLMVDVGAETGSLAEAEIEMINNVFEFDNTTVSDIATHSREIFALSVDSEISDILKAISEEKYSRIPVYEENIDDIIVILHVKDIIEHIVKNNDIDKLELRETIRKPNFIIMSKKTGELFQDMRKQKTAWQL